MLLLGTLIDKQYYELTLKSIKAQCSLTLPVNNFTHAFHARLRGTGHYYGQAYNCEA